MATLPIEVTPDLITVGGGLVWLSGSAGGKPAIIRVDEGTASLAGEPIPIDGGFDPIGVDPTGVWFFTDDRGLSLAHMNRQTLDIDASTGLKEAAAGEVPPSAAVNPQGTSIWIVNYVDSVTRVDVSYG